MKIFYYLSISPEINDYKSLQKESLLEISKNTQAQIIEHLQRVNADWFGSTEVATVMQGSVKKIVPLVITKLDLLYVMLW